MELTRYVDELQQELLIAAESGGDEARQLAERLVAPLRSATRLILLDALTAAAADITSDLAPGSVEVRLRNREPEFVVSTPDRDDPAEPTASVTSPTNEVPAPVAEADDGATSRITLRLPETLKVRIDEAANRGGLSVNTWLVRTLNAAVNPPGTRPPSPGRNPMGGHRFTGWARS